MALIRTTCSRCGAAHDLRPAQVTLRLEWSEETALDGGRYGFHCTACGQHGHRQADSIAAELLLAAGVVPEGSRFAAWSRPAPTVAEGIDVAPDFTADDVIEFHRLLDSDDWFERLRQLID